MACVAQLQLLAAALLILSIAHGLSGATIQTTTPAGCVEDGKFFMLGETYKPEPCRECRCETPGDRMSSCVISDCFFVACVDSVDDPTKCCRQCPNGPNCKHPDGTIIKPGEKYRPDPFTICKCPQDTFALYLYGALASCVAQKMTTIPRWTPVVLN